MKTKFTFSALVLMVAMAMATSAFAQGFLTVSSGVRPRAREHGQAEMAGGITLRLEAVIALFLTKITLLSIPSEN